MLSSLQYGLCQCYWHMTAGGVRAKFSKWKFHCQPNDRPFYKQHSPLPRLFIPQEHGACFQQMRMRWFRPRAQMTEVEFHSPGSTILAISDMQRTQSNGITETIGAWSRGIRLLNQKVIVHLTKIHGGAQQHPPAKSCRKTLSGHKAPWNVQPAVYCDAPGSYFGLRRKCEL